MTRFDDDATIKADAQPVLAPERTPWHLCAMRHAKCQDWRNAAGDLFGPHPEQTVEIFRDLGLNDDEIAQYFGTSLPRIKRLSDGRKRSDRFPSLREVAKMARAKLFGGIILESLLLPWVGCKEAAGCALCVTNLRSPLGVLTSDPDQSILPFNAVEFG